MTPSRFWHDLDTWEKQWKKAQQIIDGTRRMKNVRHVKVVGDTVELNRKTLDDQRRACGWKGYITSLDPDEAPTAQIISWYHQLYSVEAAFRMAKHDLDARPMYVTKQQSIEAHITRVFAAMAISRYIELKTGKSRRRIVDKLINRRTSIIQIGDTIETIEADFDDESVGILDTFKQ